MVVSEKAWLSREKLELKTSRWCVFGRTTFSYSLTAASFPDVSMVSKDNLKKIFEKIVKGFLKGEQNLSPLAFTMPPARYERR